MCPGGKRAVSSGRISGRALRGNQAHPVLCSSSCSSAANSNGGKGSGWGWGCRASRGPSKQAGTCVLTVNTGSEGDTGRSQRNCRQHGPVPSAKKPGWFRRSPWASQGSVAVQPRRSVPNFIAADRGSGRRAECLWLSLWLQKPQVFTLWPFRKCLQIPHFKINEIK